MNCENKKFIVGKIKRIKKVQFGYIWTFSTEEGNIIGLTQGVLVTERSKLVRWVERCIEKCWEENTEFDLDTLRGTQVLLELETDEFKIASAGSVRCKDLVSKVKIVA